ncbi:hypothetical protein K440DRAFT_630079 [Wilcoxina mikolae CBS 423.85]|nr:hypothetical protein K440DRAFT_630079 [Wilcoxina mikolae CBS 423.85]
MNRLFIIHNHSLAPGDSGTSRVVRNKEQALEEHESPTFEEGRREGERINKYFLELHLIEYLVSKGG